MALDSRHIRKVVRLELDPNGAGGALEHVDIVFREDGTSACIAYTIPGWHVPREGQTEEDARTVVVEHEYHRGYADWERLVTDRRDFEIRNGKLTGEWSWCLIPTDQQRSETYQEFNRIA